MYCSPTAAARPGLHHPLTAAAQRRPWQVGATLALAVLLASCGGGQSGSSNPDDSLRITAAMVPSGDSDAHRFLMQASFGPTPTDVARVKKIGYDNWIDEQFALPLQSSHLQMTDASAAFNGRTTADPSDLLNSWWTHAIEDPAQLRQRVAFALSEIFVVSTMSLSNGRSVASYMDMLTQRADANYRDLLEAVALHPAMGEYLSHRGNRKEDPNTGRVPDENFAREVMQLFSIGLYELDQSGLPRQVNNQPVETYTADDVKGLAKVFTGWSWNWPAAQSALEWWRCFWRSAECSFPDQYVTAMSPYTQEHSTSVKQFLGVTVAAQTTADPRASLKAALDRLANHPNTAPFISRQLIQRLVTSNPSDVYVADISAVFRATQGNLREVVKAILLHNEARHPALFAADAYGKLREPVLKLSHLLRALPHHSGNFNSGVAASTLAFFRATDTDNSSTSLGQTPLRAPSVFNFFRPGYKPPQTLVADADLVAPEMQITNESSVIAFANFTSTVLRDGWGQWNTAANQYDIQFDTTEWDTLASQSGPLLDAIAQRLMGQVLPSDVRTDAMAAIDAMSAADSSKRRQRINAAILLVAVSPAFTVQQ